MSLFERHYRDAVAIYGVNSDEDVNELLRVTQNKSDADKLMLLNPDSARWLANTLIEASDNHDVIALDVKGLHS